MGTIYLNDCANTTDSQNWVLLGDGRIALEPTNKSTLHLEPPIGNREMYQC